MRKEMSTLVRRGIAPDSFLFVVLAVRVPALRRFVELYAVTCNLDTISHAVSMQSRKGVPFSKWFHLDEEFIG